MKKRKLPAPKIANPKPVIGVISPLMHRFMTWKREHPREGAKFICIQTLRDLDGREFDELVEIDYEGKIPNEVIELAMKRCKKQYTFTPRKGS